MNHNGDEPTEETIAAELFVMDEQWLDRFNCDRLRGFVKEHPEWEIEFGVGECLIAIPEELRCSEQDGVHSCNFCPLQPSVKVKLWTLGNEPERKKPRPFGYGSTAEGPDEVNL